MNFKALDKKAKLVAKEYLRYEAELLNIILEIDQKKAFYQWGYSSLYAYVHEALKLSPAISYALISVARKSKVVPQLKTKIEAGELSLSKAQKMTAVLTPENQNQWFDLAQTSTHKQLERQVAIASPRQAVVEKMQYVSPQIDIAEKVQVKTSLPRVALQMGLSEKLMLKLRRAQDLESSRLKKSLSLEETLEQVVNLYLEKKDPLRKAERQKVKGQFQNLNLVSNSSLAATPILASTSTVHGKDTIINDFSGFKKNGENRKSGYDIINKINLKHSSQELLMAPQYLTFSSVFKKKNLKPQRQPLPVRLIHQVQLRDKGRCTFINSQGQRCLSQRHLEVHHLQPISQGGGNSLENLALLCSGHHKVVHCRQ